ncbi:nuclear transport factor 2 family protein [Rubricoccus marinus]|uniref:Uncharacterized protein n=1 Tax=Rubricoccus marinus TaxID=716817 RepID=A0A259U2A8_9BACT|nr:nuclear transport factor 2 family protein [Rubricoccus marinus]OZC03968.1 hypothetical protein BSZ36_13835 [Rubricoccus marinus]
MKTSTPAESLENYLAAWNATDADDCSARLLAGCAPDVVLLDPNAERPLNGWAAVASHIAYFRERHGHRMEPTGHIDAHHGVCRLPWRLADGDDVHSTGVLIADAAGDGRLQRILHFVDAPAPTPSAN